jgi:hypothetical protein
VEGRITRIIDNGFAMTVGATARKRDKLAAQLTWLANRDDILNQPRGPPPRPHHPAHDHGPKASVGAS